MNQGWLARGIWLALAGVIALSLYLGGRSFLDGGRASGELPVLYDLPEFKLIGSDGRDVSRDDLAGEVWIADFIFTSCAGVCPILSARMAEIQRSLVEDGVDAKLVSISVDPTRDHPAKLKEYGERFSADPQRWWFLTGEHDALYDLIAEGFKLSVAERSPEEAGDGGDLITHSDRFVLVDQQSRIRGYYHGTERESLERLIVDVSALVRGG